MVEPANLDFERADFGEQGRSLACAVCHTALADSYFEINQKTVCERCRYQVEWDWKNSSASSRLLRALAFGVVAAGLGSLLYYAVYRITEVVTGNGYQLSLIAIVVGFMVGSAVRMGSR